MKVYLVLESWDCEGCGEPQAIYTSREKAQVFADRLLSQKYHADYITVVEYELDKEPEQ